MSVMRVIVLHIVHPYTKFEVIRLSVTKIWLMFGHGANRPYDLDL